MKLTPIINSYQIFKLLKEPELVSKSVRSPITIRRMMLRGLFGEVSVSPLSGGRYSYSVNTKDFYRNYLGNLLSAQEFWKIFGRWAGVPKEALDKIVTD